MRQTFVDLGLSPLCESYVDASALNAPETLYPLHCFVCENCFLVQLPEHVAPGAIFREYAYFSSYSDTWLKHAEAYAEMISARLKLSAQSLVLEVASNDGYLLQYFRARGIPVLGVEPARNIAQAAVAKGIATVTDFFGVELARELLCQGRKADLLIGNNVLAHVPDINDFVAGVKILLKPRGVITMEFPHLIRLIEENQFDTIYHEHFSYLSFTTTEQIFHSHGLKLFDVEELTTHGGSLRIFACHVDDPRPISHRAEELRKRESDWGVNRLERYQAFAETAKAAKRNILRFLLTARDKQQTVVGYGAPGKGNTLLNYCGIRADFVEYTVDRSRYKQGKFTPGTRIPIHPPEQIRQTKPDFVLILPWNLREEIMEQNTFIRDWGGRFVVPIPDVKVYA